LVPPRPQLSVLRWFRMQFFALVISSPSALPSCHLLEFSHHLPYPTLEKSDIRTHTSSPKLLNIHSTSQLHRTPPIMTQALPPEILRLVFEHNSIGSARYDTSPSDPLSEEMRSWNVAPSSSTDYHESKRRIMPLMLVCRYWRDLGGGVFLQNV
jgi:hypothetical protein